MIPYVVAPQALGKAPSLIIPLVVAFEAGDQGYHLVVDRLVPSIDGCILARENPVAREAGVLVAPVVDRVARVVCVDHSHLARQVGKRCVGGELDGALPVGLARAC